MVWALVGLILAIFLMAYYLDKWLKNSINNLNKRPLVVLPKGKPEPLQRSKLVRVYKTEADYLFEQAKKSASLVFKSTAAPLDFKRSAEVYNKAEYEMLERNSDYKPVGEYSFPVRVLNPTSAGRHTINFGSEQYSRIIEVTYVDPNLKPLTGYFATELSLAREL